MTLKAPVPAAVAVTLVVLPAAGVTMTPRLATTAKRAVMNTRGFTERMKSPPSTRLLFPAVAIKGLSRKQTLKRFVRFSCWPSRASTSARFKISRDPRDSLVRGPAEQPAGCRRSDQAPA